MYHSLHHHTLRYPHSAALGTRCHSYYIEGQTGKKVSRPQILDRDLFAGSRALFKRSLLPFWPWLLLLLMLLVRLLRTYYICSSATIGWPSDNGSSRSSSGRNTSRVYSSRSSRFLYFEGLVSLHPFVSSFFLYVLCCLVSGRAGTDIYNIARLYMALKKRDEETFCLSVSSYIY